MKKSISIGIVGMILSLLLAQNIASMTTPEPQMRIIDGDFEIIQIGVDRVEYTENLAKTLEKAPLVIVKGTVIDSKMIPNEMNSLPLTLFTIQVDEVIKGAIDSYIINIWQYGGKIEVEINGTYKEYFYQVSDDPPLIVGEEAIYLLVKTEVPDAYRLWGAYQGHYVIQNGHVFNVAEVTPELAEQATEAVFTKGISYSQFKAQLSK